MPRIAIITCTNCTQETNCASAPCLRDMRARNGFFQRYPKEEPLELVGIISCAGCPTAIAPEKILKRVAAVAADYALDALHFSYCLTHLCPFVAKYQKIIRQAYPDLEIVLGTHPQSEKGVKKFRRAVKEMLVPTLCPPQDMNTFVRGTFKMKSDP